MEFYVVDPKTSDYTSWVERVRGFLDTNEFKYTEEEGGLYYLGDDVASPWDEDSILFRIDGDEGGVVEVRNTDKNFYVFTEELDMFGDREVHDAVGFVARPSCALYGFRWNNKKGCRFHLGPSTGLSFFCDDREADYPMPQDLPDSWNLFFRTVHWLSNWTSRIQDLRNRPVEKTFLDFEANVTFSHPASLDVLNELLVEEEGYERTKSGLRATFRERDLTWIRRFVSLLPSEDEDFKEATFRAVWRGAWQGEEREIFYVGLERRHLRPFVQLPVQRSSKAFVERFRAHFKGHRIDRQEYSL